MSENKFIISAETIQRTIFTVRGVQVIVDRDLAVLYDVENKRLNEQVRRNEARFPERFCFQLTEAEKDELVANCDRFSSMKHSTSLPYVFTEQGVSMLSAVLRSETAIKVSIQIMDTFVTMRKFFADHATILHRLENVEQKQFIADHKMEKVFQAIEASDVKPVQGVFFDGQIFDAYVFINDLIRHAQKSIVLIDNYVDDSVLQQLAKRAKNVRAVILTKTISKVLAQDLKKHNAQYPLITLKPFAHSHDRFLLIDDDVYHIGASLKDLGKKWFAFSKMDKAGLTVMAKIEEVLGYGK